MNFTSTTSSNPIINMLNSAHEAQSLGEAKTKSDSERLEDAKAIEAGTGFEAVFMSLLLKEMRESADFGEGGMFGSDKSDTYGGMFDMFVGQSVAETGQLGISDMVKTYLANKSSI